MRGNVPNPPTRVPPTHARIGVREWGRVARYVACCAHPTQPAPPHIASHGDVAISPIRPPRELQAPAPAPASRDTQYACIGIRERGRMAQKKSWDYRRTRAVSTQPRLAPPPPTQPTQPSSAPLHLSGRKEGSELESHRKRQGVVIKPASLGDPGTRSTTTSRQSSGTVGRASGPIAKGIRSGISDTSNALAPSFVLQLVCVPKDPVPSYEAQEKNLRKTEAKSGLLGPRILDQVFATPWVSKTASNRGRQKVFSGRSFVRIYNDRMTSPSPVNNQLDRKIAPTKKNRRHAWRKKNGRPSRGRKEEKKTPRDIAATMRTNAAPMSPRVSQPASSTSPSQRAALYLLGPARKHANKPAHRRAAVTLPSDAGERPQSARAAPTYVSARESEDVRLSTSPAHQRTFPPHQPQQKESSCGSEGGEYPNAPARHRSRNRRTRATLIDARRPADAAHPCPPASQQKEGMLGQVIPPPTPPSYQSVNTDASVHPRQSTGTVAPPPPRIPPHARSPHRKEGRGWAQVVSPPSHPRTSPRRPPLYPIGSKEGRTPTDAPALDRRGRVPLPMRTRRLGRVAPFRTRAAAHPH
ncbi:hypothetical protein C8J57DRAFT_1458524 [Mycena rebaudengoi]|nr:hypothetical protein C8J57DRAFT_1458524 [Mycena rebaudengoi]